MKSILYLTAYLAVALSTTGILFKFQHWPGAAIMMIAGIFILNFVFLPMYLIRKAQVNRA